MPALFGWLLLGLLGIAMIAIILAIIQIMASRKLLAEAQEDLDISQLEIEAMVKEIEYCHRELDARDTRIRELADELRNARRGVEFKNGSWNRL